MVQYRHPTPRSTWGVQWFAVAMVQWSPLGLAVGPTCVSVNLSVMGLQGWEGLCGEVGLMSWDKHFQLVLLGSLLVIMVVGHETFMEPPVGLLTTGTVYTSVEDFSFSAGAAWLIVCQMKWICIRWLTDSFFICIWIKETEWWPILSWFERSVLKISSVIKNIKN